MRLDPDAFRFAVVAATMSLIGTLFQGEYLLALPVAIGVLVLVYAVFAFTPLAAWVRARRSPHAVHLVWIGIAGVVFTGLVDGDWLLALGFAVVWGVAGYLLLTRTRPGRRFDAWDDALERDL